jgi:hypothetical protein
MINSNACRMSPLPSSIPGKSLAPLSDNENGLAPRRALAMELIAALVPSYHRGPRFF